MNQHGPRADEKGFVMFPKQLDEWSDRALLDELLRRVRVRADGRCAYCNRPHRAEPWCREQKEHVGDEKPITQLLAGYEATALEHNLKVGWSDEKKRSCFALGLAGEAGEVADLVKKHLHHDREINRADLTKELGDVLWYLTALAWAYGITLDEVAVANIAKLRARFPSGKWTPEAANAYADRKQGGT